MKKRAFLVVSIVLALTLVLAGTSIAQQKKFFVISTGGTGGTYYPLGGILAQALTEKVPEVVTTAQAGQASVANCNLIRDKQIESAFVQSNVAYNAYKGLEQFKEKPATNLRFIASLYPETIQIVARADSGIKTVKDIKGKRVVPGDRGSGTEVDAQNVLSAYDMWDGKSYKGLSMLLDSPRTATARVASPEARLLAIPRASFELLLRENPEIVQRMLREMAERLRATSERIGAADAGSGPGVPGHR